MPTPRFYLQQELKPGDETALPEPVRRHALQVLRLRAGAALVLFNGDGAEYPASLIRAGRREAVARVERRVARDRETPLAIGLVQAVAKGERTDFALQKAVELGAAGLRLVFSERGVARIGGERLERRLTHWRAVVVSACEQCGRNRVPPLHPPLPLADWLARSVPPQTTRLLLDPAAETGLAAQRPAAALELLAGPEGGLSAAELAAARTAGFVGVRLGPRVLRTETAALAALAACQTLWGDLGDR